MYIFFLLFEKIEINALHICVQLADQSHRKRCQMTKRKNTYFLTLLILTIQLSEQCSKSEKEIHGGVRWIYSVVLSFGIQKIEQKVKQII